MDKKTAHEGRFNFFPDESTTYGFIEIGLSITAYIFLFSSSFSGSPDNQSINDGRIDKPSSLVWILLVFADLDSFTAAFKGLDWILLFQLLSFIGLDLVFGLSDLDASAFRGIGLV